MVPISRSTSGASTRPVFARSMPPRSFRCRARRKSPPDRISFRLKRSARGSLSRCSFARLLSHTLRIELQRARTDREFAALAVARVFDVDPGVGVDAVAGNVIARLQDAHQDLPGGEL